MHSRFIELRDKPLTGRIRLLVDVRLSRCGSQFCRATTCMRWRPDILHRPLSRSQVQHTSLLHTVACLRSLYLEVEEVITRTRLGRGKQGTESRSGLHDIGRARCSRLEAATKDRWTRQCLVLSWAALVCRFGQFRHRQVRAESLRRNTTAYRLTLSLHTALPCAGQCLLHSLAWRWV